MDDDAYKVMHHSFCLLYIVMTQKCICFSGCSGAERHSSDTASFSTLMQCSMTAWAACMPMSVMAKRNLVDWPVCKIDARAWCPKTWP